MRQMAGAGSLEEAVGLLRDTWYAPYFADAATPGDAFEMSLQKALSDCYDAVLAYAGEPLAVTVFRARYDFHNVKVVVKDRCLGIPSDEEALSIVGNLKPSRMHELLGGEALERFKPRRPGMDFTGRADVLLEENALVLAYLTARGLVPGEPDVSNPAVLAFLADGSVDASYYRWASRELRRLGYPELRGFLAAEVDLLNVRMAVRAAKHGIAASLFGRIALPGGDVGARDLGDAYGLGPQEVVQLYERTQWGGLCASGMGLLERGEPLTSWEKECDDTLIRVYRKARHIGIGPEPVVGYLLGKEIECRNLRVVLAGKESGLPASEIVERLRETYV